MSKIDAIIFDLDGTLWDATETICKIYNEVLEKYYPEYQREVPLAEVQGYMGKTMLDIGKGIMQGASDETCLEFMDKCSEEECVYLAKYNGRIFDGVIETLTELSKEYPLYIVSNCQAGYIESFLEANNCKDLFVDWQWNTGGGITKGELNKQIIKRNEIKNGIYVGDILGDALSAREAGLKFIHAAYGFGKVNEKYCIAKIDSFRELKAKIRLQQQMDFILEIDKEKFIGRQTYLSDGSRKENDAEHAWHLAMMAMLLGEHANEKVDNFKVMSMVLIHDLVEIYAGDTYAYDTVLGQTQRQREIEAADKLFNLLPADQATSMRALWDEFEEEKTPEAKFARTLDKVQPLMLNIASGGRSWEEHEVHKSQVLKRNEKTPLGSKNLWEMGKRWIERGAEEGMLFDD